MFITTAIQNSIVNDIVTELVTAIGSAGFLRFLTGTVPVDADAAETGTNVVENALSSTPIGTAIGNNFVFNAISDGTATNAGTITYCRVYSASVVAIAQFTCGAIAGEIMFDSDVFIAGDTCHIASLEVDCTFA